MKKADGAYSEPLAMTAKKFVETHTKEFLGYFLNERMLSVSEFDDWAGKVCGEIMIMAENREQQEIKNVHAKMQSGCVQCNSLEKQKLEEFFRRIKNDCD